MAAVVETAPVLTGAAMAAIPELGRAASEDSQPSPVPARLRRCRRRRAGAGTWRQRHRRRDARQLAGRWWGLPRWCRC
ncbi:hypothetical protein I546_1879 [Mycobacterium kansasii 732]|nr:hypothetical protein I546_1879 [Mycobacterium kansasii 732]